MKNLGTFFVLSHPTFVAKIVTRRDMLIISVKKDFDGEGVSGLENLFFSSGGSNLSEFDGGRSEKASFFLRSVTGAKISVEKTRSHESN